MRTKTWWILGFVGHVLLSHRVGTAAVLLLGVILLASCGRKGNLIPGPENSPPVADAGTDMISSLGIVTLDGSNSSDPDGDALSYQWTLTKPPASLSVLSDDAAISPTFDADTIGLYEAQLIVNDGDVNSAADTVTIQIVAPPGITPFSRTIGAGLQFSETADLDIADHGGVTVRVESNNPTVALVAPDSNTPGSAFVDVFVADGSTTAGYTIQGVAGTSGTVTITASASGFTSGTGTITVVQPALAIQGLNDTQSVGTNRVFSVALGLPDGANIGLSSFQGASAANVPPLEITITSSNGVVGQLISGGSTEAVLTVEATADLAQADITFVPLEAGSTTVSASIPGFAMTASATQVIGVDAPGISPFSRTIGAGLQYSNNADLDIADHGGVTVRIESSDPSVALIAPSGNTPGSSFIDVFVSDGDAVADYTVQGVAGATGTVTITASAPGFAGGTGTITVVQPGIVISALADTRSVGSNDVFTVLTGYPNGSGTGLSGIQGMSAANVPPLVLTVTSSNGTVGQLNLAGNTSDVVTSDMTAGTFQQSVTFLPLTAGNAEVSASIPGFLSTSAATQVVTVTDP